MRNQNRFEKPCATFHFRGKGAKGQEVKKDKGIENNCPLAPLPLYPLALLLISILSFPLSAISARWFDSDWKCRRGVRIVRADEPDSDVAIVDIYTGELSKKDGSDFRVTDEEGNLLPYYIVFLQNLEPRNIEKRNK